MQIASRVEKRTYYCVEAKNRIKYENRKALFERRIRIMNIDQNTERWEQLLPSSTLSSRDELPVSMKAFPMDDLEKDYREIITGISFRNLQ